MTAAEKLKALEARGRAALKEPISQSSRWKLEMVLADLLDALPQIVAVVEAMSRVPLWKLEDEEAQPILDSLAALDDALTADGKTPK